MRPLGHSSQVTFLYQMTSKCSLLRNSVLEPQTLKRYKAAVNDFLNFLSENNIKVKKDKQIDSALANYIEYLFFHRLGKHKASLTFHGLLFFSPQLKWRLYESQLRIRGWNKLEPSKSHPPLTLELVILIATTMARNNYLPHAIATLLAFDCYLRISEFCRLHINDVAMPNDFRTLANHTQTVLRLRTPKRAKNQSVMMDNSQIVTVLTWYLRSLPQPIHKEGSLFPFSTGTYRNLFMATCEALGLGSTHFTPHSLRHGAATRDYLRGVPISSIQSRGRWKNQKTTEIYIQTSRAVLLMLDLPDQTIKSAKWLSNLRITTIFKEFFPNKITQP
jgi:integrase